MGLYDKSPSSGAAVSLPSMGPPLTPQKSAMGTAGGAGGRVGGRVLVGGGAVRVGAGGRVLVGVSEGTPGALVTGAGVSLGTGRLVEPFSPGLAVAVRLGRAVAVAVAVVVAV